MHSNRRATPEPSSENRPRLAQYCKPYELLRFLSGSILLATRGVRKPIKRHVKFESFEFQEVQISVAVCFHNRRHYFTCEELVLDSTVA